MSLPPMLLDFVSSIPDPRRNTWLTIHPLENILGIALLAILCGAEDFTTIADWAQLRKPWLQQWFDLRHDTPSHDTFSRVFALLDPVAFNQAFIALTQSIATVAEDFVALDGKTLRACRTPDSSALHLLNAWSSANALALGQWRVGDKENEICGLPHLIRLLNLEGACVTVDAMGCQVRVAEAILEKSADYLLRVKGNQGALHQDLRELFDPLRAQELEWPHHFFQEVEKGHGRLETRRVWVSSQLEGLQSTGRWPQLQSIMCIESEREQLGSGKTTRMVKYFISSREVHTLGQARELAHGVRLHWGIENKLHWVLDVQMNEDRCRVSHGAELLSQWRKLALNLHRKDKRMKSGAKAKMLFAASDQDYLLGVLRSTFL